MGAGRFWGRGALIAGVIAVGLLIALPPAVSAASPAASGGAPAAECRHGGWAALTPDDAPGEHFRNQGQCVRYMMGGGAATVPGDADRPGMGVPGDCKGPL